MSWLKNTVVLYYTRPKNKPDGGLKQSKTYTSKNAFSEAIYAAQCLALDGYAVSVVLNGVEIINWREEFILELWGLG